MYQCKSGRHWWLSASDAAKCCNGYRRVLVLGGGDNQQVCAGVSVGRRWVKIESDRNEGEPGGANDVDR